MVDISKKLSNGNNTYDTSYYKFTCMLKYKLENLGKELIKVDKWYPSSKICSNCGFQKNVIKLDERVYECKNCGIVLNRDLNAAINIRNEGIRLLNQ
jgi:putative transposase